MSLYNSCFVKHVTNPKSDEYKLKAVVLNIARHNLLKSVVKDKSFFLSHFQQYFSYLMATSFSGGRSRSIRKEPPTMSKQLINFITCAASRIMFSGFRLLCMLNVLGIPSVMYVKCFRGSVCYVC
jgi:hypothetical protein